MNRTTQNKVVHKDTKKKSDFNTCSLCGKPASHIVRVLSTEGRIVTMPVCECCNWPEMK